MKILFQYKRDGKAMKKRKEGNKRAKGTVERKRGEG